MLPGEASGLQLKLHRSTGGSGIDCGSTSPVRCLTRGKCLSGDPAAKLAVAGELQRLGRPPLPRYWQGIPSAVGSTPSPGKGGGGFGPPEKR